MGVFEGTGPGELFCMVLLLMESQEAMSVGSPNWKPEIALNATHSLHAVQLAGEAAGPAQVTLPNKPNPRNQRC